LTLLDANKYDSFSLFISESKNHVCVAALLHQELSPAKLGGLRLMGRVDLHNLINVVDRIYFVLGDPADEC
jgi:hypothetical protein